MESDAARDLTTQCCIAGGGPAGLVPGYLLARAGVRVAAFGKHEDFLRDFRGDTIHPSTLAVLQDVGPLDAFLALPHQETGELTGEVYGQRITLASWDDIKLPSVRISHMPCWHREGLLCIGVGPERVHPGILRVPQP